METQIDIKIERNQEDQNFSTITIDDKTNPIITVQTTSVDSECQREDDVLVIKQWVRKIKNNGDACNIIGLSVDCSLHYKNGTNKSFDYPKKEDHPIEILQLCIGNQCLIYEAVDSYHSFLSKKDVPKALKDLLSDARFVVVGVGMEEVAKKLESQLGLKISQPRELRTMAGFSGKKCSLEKLAKRVLGGDWKKPSSMSWWKDGIIGGLSDDKIKYGTVEAFLAYEMGKKLLKK
ncbi:uncharacterized protein LOC113752524 [Coffea eugenioides]|uniref:uncharacterized protein LOC113752524 n=1 Tax=Coffea eugenioides TaxID=49369 RepID=UPI000F6147C3|nr:uncharacterized protein LOC113752524 [Coffea eugenioides]